MQREGYILQYRSKVEINRLMDLSLYQLETLHQDGEFILYRGERTSIGETGPASLLALSAVAEHPAPETIQKIEHEFSLRDDLDPAWAIRPIGLTQKQSQIILLLEDSKGEPLDRLFGWPMELEPCLRCGVKQPGSWGIYGYQTCGVRGADGI